MPFSEITASKPRSPSFSPVLRGSWPRSRCTLICSGSSPSTPEASPGFHPKKAGSRGDRLGSRYRSEWDALGASSTSVVDRSMPRSPPSTGFVPAFWPPRGALVIRRSTATSESRRPMISCRRLRGLELPECCHHCGFDPLVATTAHGGCRAVLVGDPLVSTTERQDLRELLEDRPVGDAGPVRAERVVRLARSGSKAPNRSQELGSMRYARSAGTRYTLLHIGKLRELPG